VQRLTTRREQSERLDALESADEIAHGTDDVFAVVEDQIDIAVGEVVDDRVDDVHSGLPASTDRIGGRVGHGVGVGDGGQVTEVDPDVALALERRTHFHGQPCLPHATGTDQRDDGMAAVQERCDLGGGLGSADEGGLGAWEIARHHGLAERAFVRVVAVVEHHEDLLDADAPQSVRPLAPKSDIGEQTGRRP